MSLEIDILRALLRLARRRTPPTLAQLADRVQGDDAAIRSSLQSLAKSGLVQRTPAGLTLSLAGLAVAVAFAQRPKTSKANKGTTRDKAAARDAEAATTSATQHGTRRHRAA